MPRALTIGNFDGVHAGHRLILRRVREIALERGLDSAVLTFDPHPAKVVAPERAPLLMTTPAERAELMKATGIAEVTILPFDRVLCQLTPEEFVQQILAERLQARAVVVGDNFRFGHCQAGDVGTLTELGQRFGFTVEVTPAVHMRGAAVSSSTVRALVREGRVARAARYLERPYALRGEVVRGHGVGRKQTVPTLNLAPTAEVLPRDGVYVTRTRDLDNARKWQSITNVGMRPTFEGDALTVETFLLEPLTGISPERIEVEFLWRLRDERRFPTPELLKQQILRDVGRARRYFGRRARWGVC